MEPVALLKANIAKLSPSDAAFANSLIKQYDQRGKLSEKQWPWVHKLNEKAEKGAPVPQQVQLGASMAGLIALFDNAKKHLKKPAINLSTPDGFPVKVYIAGSKSKTPGFVQVTDGGGFGEGIWYGRVSPAGVWEKSQSEKAQKGMTSVQALLIALAANPAHTAGEYGKLTGRCCF